ncbi:MAG: hypothetical protein KJ757_04720 [Planctomycetes bacterium]|nr:hypothetical protein [Planctomycetota bacterium]MBU1517476.1 hypothetical protein [Planctomycetota bacterium]MBU2457424.1 hypothetical protein [Planctomycetota bacterium]MBU2596847.1 hypothetical protein [Planctomycetota bacterium]
MCLCDCGDNTESAAYALSKVSSDKRAEVIKAYFDPVNGLGYSLCRTHINSCDFSLNNYAHDEVVGDTELKHFNIERDRKLLIPFIKDAMAVPGAKFKIFASPWSPPGWMKTNDAIEFVLGQSKGVAKISSPAHSIITLVFYEPFHNLKSYPF